MGYSPWHHRVDSTERLSVRMHTHTHTLVQNLETKMESQIYSLETRIEKMQERFNKDLEEIKDL